MNLLAIGVGLATLSFVVAAGLTRAAMLLAPRVGLVDKPGGRKAHRAPTPLAGGVAIWATTISVLAASAVGLWLGRSLLPESIAVHASGLWSKGGTLLLLMGLATIIMLMGLADDRWGLGWRIRLFVQFGLAGILVVSGVRVTLFWPFNNEILTGVLTAFWIVGLTNSFNFLDNMDGLAAGVGLIAALLFAVAQIIAGDLFVPILLLILAGSLGGFLRYNKSPARIFMGDAGSNFLGFLLGALTVLGTFTRPELGLSRYSVLSPLLIMAVPLYDTFSVITIRIREGRSPFQPDRKHFSHRLVERGLTNVGAVRTIYLVTLASGLGTLLLPKLVDFAGASVVIAQTLCLLGVIAILEFSTNRPEPHRDGPATSPQPPVEPLQARPADPVGPAA